MTTQNPEDNQDDEEFLIVSVPESDVVIETPESSTDPEDDDDDLVVTPVSSSDAAAEEETSDEDDDQDRVQAGVPEETELDSDTLEFPRDIVDFRGETLENITALLKKIADTIGAAALDERVRTPGTYENILARSVFDVNTEEHRIQQAISALSSEDRDAMSNRLVDKETGKVILRNSRIGGGIQKSESTQILSGISALLAFENVGDRSKKSSGSWRVMLYNSGISVDLIAPTLNDYDTFVSNCNALSDELGTSLGGHYYTYGDIAYKYQIVSFIQSLIVDSSFSGWEKNGKLWSVIKMPDIATLMMSIAASSYPDGFDGFMVRCSSQKEPLCGHYEKLNVNLFKMIHTRWNVLSTAAIQHLTGARQRVGHSHSLSEISKYQSGLGLEGEKIVIDDITLIMRIPTVNEYLNAARTFIEDIINEIRGDNTEGQVRQLGLRYIRTFLPWISAIEATLADGSVIRTSDVKVITRQLEKIDATNSDTLREALIGYTNRAQLTYIGYPILPCPKCGEQPETPSGLYSIDPITTFFTLASVATTRNG